MSCEEVASCLTIERVTHFMKNDLYTFRMNARTRTHSTHDEHSIVPFPNMEVTFCQSNHCNGYYKLKCHGWTVLLRAALIHTYIKSQIFLRKSEKAEKNTNVEMKWNKINNKIYNIHKVNLLHSSVRIFHLNMTFAIWLYVFIISISHYV